MLSKLRKIKKNGFTMVELIFVCVVFAMLISGIILAINRSYAFLSNTRVQIRATNLTREGMEMMFNIRDTNRRKYSGEKDKYWLYMGSGNNQQPINFFQKGIYIIKEGVSNGDKFIYAEKLGGINSDTDIEKFYDSDGFFTEAYSGPREKAKVVFTGTYSYLSGGAESGEVVTGNISDLLGDGVEFYRIARIYGIYCKTASSSDQPAGGGYCNNASDPKEMRFCVKTFYKLGAGTHSLELCSMMTNFME